LKAEPSKSKATTKVTASAAKAAAALAKQQAEAHDQCHHADALAVFTSLRSWKNSF